MKRAAALASLVAAAGCTAPSTAGDAGPPIPERGSGRVCDAAKAQHLVGRPASDALAAEAMRLTGAGTLRWVAMGMMVTMDYRPDRLNIHLGPRHEVTKIACG